MPKLTPTPLIIEGDASGGFVPEFWGNVAGVKAVGMTKLVVQGNNRLYAVASIPTRPEPEYADITYKKFQLFDRELTFDVDMSGVGCGCNAAAYLVAMPEHPSATDSAYCDIQGPEGVSPCLEIDLIEGNTKALQSTLHTGPGHGSDGATCNQDGCAGNFGKDSRQAHLYGPGATKGIDSTRPFTVRASFRGGLHGGAIYDVSLAQSSKTPSQDQEQPQQGLSKESEDRILHLFNAESVYGSHVANGPARPAPVPSGDRLRTHAALSNGMVLVVSLWSADDLSWLDGGCDAAHPKCVIENARFEISNLRTSTVPSPPSPPPMPPPYMPPATPPTLLSENVQMMLWALMLVASLLVAFYVMRQRGQSDAKHGRRSSGGRRKASQRRIDASRDYDDDEEEDAIRMSTSRI